MFKKFFITLQGLKKLRIKGSPLLIIYDVLRRVRKRVRIVFASLIWAFVFLYATFFPPDRVFFFFFIFLIISYLLTFIALLEDIRGVEWVMLFIMPVMISTTLYIFYFLFPGRWLTRIPFVFSFGLLIYAILLTNNVFNTHAEKNIQLYRAAFSINYLLQSIVIFLLGIIVYSLHWGVLFILIASFIISFVLGLQFIWSIKLEEKLSLESLKYAFLISILTSEIAVILSFVPLSEVSFGIALSGFFYFISGYLYLLVEEKLFEETLREFKIIIFLVIIFLLLSIKF